MNAAIRVSQIGMAAGAMSHPAKATLPQIPKTIASKKPSHSRPVRINPVPGKRMFNSRQTTKFPA